MDTFYIKVLSFVTNGISFLYNLHVHGTDEKIIHYFNKDSYYENLKERNHLEGLDIVGMIIL